MASGLTSKDSSPSGNLRPQILPKHRPLEFIGNTAPSPKSSLSNNDYIFGDCKLLAAVDEKFSELQPHLEARERTQCYIRNFLQRKAEKFRRGEDVDSDDKYGELVVPVIMIPFESKAEMVKLENRSFVFKLWLHRIEIIRCEDKDKGASLHDLEHAVYEAQEAIEEYKEFITKNYYNMEKLIKVRPFYTDRLDTTLSKALEEKEKARFELKMEDFDRFHSPTVRLSALLGLKLDFLDRLKEMPPEHCQHRTPGEWIVTFLRNNGESLPSTDNKAVTKELLGTIGFDPLSTAVETIISRSRNMQRHIEACECAEIFIRDEVKYHPLLYSLSVPYPFQANLTNSWFQLSSRIDEESESEVDPCHVNIMNLVTEESDESSITQAILDDFLPRDEQHVLLYHGTDHFSAADILLRGIDLCAGRKKRDFSCGSGFYLTNSLDGALNWAKSTTAKPAILIFQVNHAILNDARRLNLDSNEERWSEIVSSFRSGRRTAKKRRSLSSFDLIEGPVATLIGGESSDKIVFEPKRSSYQMCLISDDYAEKFHKTLHSIFFFYFS